MNDKEWHEQVEKKPKGRFLIPIILALLVGFLAGYIPTRSKSVNRAERLENVESRLEASEMQNYLANAAMNARRGEYEPARQAASQFFTSLGEEMRQPESSFITPEQRPKLEQILKERDQLITLLARGDSAAAERLSDTYFNFLQVKGPGNAVLAAQQQQQQQR